MNQAETKRFEELYQRHLTLSLQIRDIDAEPKRAHIRRGKGHKDRMVPFS